MSSDREAESPASAADEPPQSESSAALTRAMEDFVALLESGEAPDVKAFVQLYPGIAHELAACLEGLAFIHRVAPQLDDETPGGSKSDQIQPLAALGDFRIVRQIGKGGMGVVYEAVQLSLGRRVALKVLPFAATLDPRHLQRFRNEAQAAAHLQHTNIVPVYAVGCDRGVHYYAMQFVDGVSLDVVVRAMQSDEADGDASGVAPDPSDKAASTAAVAILSTARSANRVGYFRCVAELGMQVAGALEFAHQRGIVHRDIKPSNLLLDERGNLWITDFGLARMEGAANLTLTGDTPGTLRYMSPEQALPTTGLIDQRTDIYSLGVTLYELLTLQAAFPSSDRATLLRTIAADDPVPPRKLNRDIPQDLETIVLKAMQKDVAARYATAAELGDDLRRFSEHQPIRARRPTVIDSGVKWLRRHAPIVFAGSLAAFLVGSVCLGIIAHQRNVAISRERHIAKQAEQIQHYLFVSDMRLGWYLWQDAAEISNLAAVLQRHLPQRGGHDVRGFAWYYLLGLARATKPTIEAHTGEAYHLGFSPDGRLLVSAGADKVVRFWDGTTGAFRATLAGHDDEVNCFDFSADGRRLATSGDDGKICVWDVSTRKVLYTLHRPGKKVTRIVLSGSGEFLASYDRDGPVCVWHVPSGERKPDIPGRFILAKGPTDDVIVLGSKEKGDRAIRLLDLRTSEESPFLQSHAGELFYPVGVFSRDRSLFAVVVNAERVQVYDCGTREQMGTMSGQSWRIESLAYSPDGSKLVSAARDRTVRVWDVAGFSEASRYRGHPKRAWYGVFSPDGKRVWSIAGDGGIRSWPVGTTQEYQSLPHPAGIRALRFSPDGRLLATACNDRHIRLWDAKSGEQLPVLTCPEGEQVTALAFSPDGRSIFGATKEFVRHWELPSGRELPPSTGHSDWVTCLTASPKSDLLAAVDAKHKISVWRQGPGLENGELPATRQFFEGNTTVAFSPDGASLYSKAWSIVRRFDPLTGECLATLDPGTDPTFIAVSPSDGTLACASINGYLLFLDSKSLSETRRVIAPATLSTLAFSPGGETLASGRFDGGVTLWDVVTGQELFSLTGHTGTISSVAFSPDGRTLATGSQAANGSGEVFLWRAATDEQVSEFLTGTEFPSGSSSH